MIYFVKKKSFKFLGTNRHENSSLNLTTNKALAYKLRFLLHL